MKRCTVVAVVFGLFACAFVYAGDGRIEISQSMMPYTITNSGSYILTENLVVTNLNGITVATNDVTIDLNGFTLQGPGALTGYGIYQTAAYRNLVIHNGTLTAWGAQYAIYAAGKNNQIRNIVASHNSSGIYSGEGSFISECNIHSNVMATSFTLYGILVESGSQTNPVPKLTSVRSLIYGIRTWVDLHTAL